MKRFFWVITPIIGTAILASVAFLIAAPQLNWCAAAKPGPIETTFARYVIGRWVWTNASLQPNPLSATPDNLRLGRDDFNEHCATCHGLDGSGRNRFEAAFYTPFRN
jgi:mono/diheme cytochrome c family protein